MTDTRGARRVLIPLTLLFGLAFLPSLVLGPFAGLLYDEPGTGGLLVGTLFWSWASLWLVILLSLPAAWLAYRAGRFRRAVWLACLPFVNVALIVITGFAWFD